MGDDVLGHLDLGAVVLEAAYVVAAEEIAQGDEQTARGDEGDHVGHARHHGLL